MVAHQHDVMRNIAILLYDDVEDLDFCGPLEIFTVACRLSREKPFNVFTVADQLSIRCSSGLSVNPDFQLGNHPPPDILIVPGGRGARRQTGNQQLLRWINEWLPRVEILLSVCTGALLLGQIGILNGLRVTTHRQAMDSLSKLAPEAILVKDCRFCDNGTVVTAGGVCAGIDASLHIIKRLQGSEAANDVAKFIEYLGHPPWVVEQA